MNCDIVLCQIIEPQIIGEKMPMPLERFNSMDGQARCKLAGQNQVVANGGADVDETPICRQTLDQPNENILFVCLVNISFPIACTLFIEELILENTHPILEG